MRFAQYATVSTRSSRLHPPQMAPSISEDSLFTGIHYSPLLSFVNFLANRKLTKNQKVKTNKAGLRLFVCMRFQDLFHSPPGVLFAFPSRYWFTIGRSRVFSLGGWSPHVQTGFHVSRPTCRKLSSTKMISYKGLSPSMAGLSIPFYYQKC